METEGIITIVVAVVLVLIVAAVALSVYRKKQTDQLRNDFGEEYERTVERDGDRRSAESELRERRKMHDSLDIRPLTTLEAGGFTSRWHDVQARFVDDPDNAVADADDLVADVMRTRGYDLDAIDDDTDGRDVIDLVSVDHPDVVQQYREGHDLYRRSLTGDGSTEDLRQAMMRFRSLFEALVDERTADQRH